VFQLVYGSVQISPGNGIIAAKICTERNLLLYNKMFLKMYLNLFLIIYDTQNYKLYSLLLKIKHFIYGV